MGSRRKGFRQIYKRNGEYINKKKTIMKSADNKVGGKSYL